MIGAIATALGSLASIGTGIFNSVKQNEANEENFKLQKKQLRQNKTIADRDFNYNKELQEKIFQREDSSVQRMVEDNRKAGLSPIAGLAGAGTGQALEANTPTFSAPQMSANQLAVDFSSLSSLGHQIDNYELSKDQLKLNQERLGLEKSSNELNLRQMEANIQATDIKNQIARATVEDEIAGKKLSNKRVEKEIARIGVQTVGDALSNDLKSLDKVQTTREMEEWLENKGLRADLGNYSLEEAKARALAMQMLNEHNQERYGVVLDTLREQYDSIKRENDSAESWQEVLDSLGMTSGESALLGKVVGFILRLGGLQSLHK